MTQDKSGREARLKLALRDNLRKRKAQERDSRDPDGGPESAGPNDEAGSPES